MQRQALDRTTWASRAGNTVVRALEDNKECDMHRRKDRDVSRIDRNVSMRCNGVRHGIRGPVCLSCQSICIGRRSVYL
jgi:hypothetical protein